MAGLISDQLLSNLRRVANKQLITPVIVRRPTQAESPMGTVETMSIIATTTCWYKPKFKGNLELSAGNIVANESNAEIRFDINTDVLPGDVLEIAGEGNFVVQDTTTGATIQLYLKAWVDRMEPSPDG